MGLTDDALTLSYDSQRVRYVVLPQGINTPYEYVFPLRRRPFYPLGYKIFDTTILLHSDRVHVTHLVSPLQADANVARTGTP